MQKKYFIFSLFYKLCIFSLWVPYIPLYCLMVKLIMIILCVNKLNEEKKTFLLLISEFILLKLVFGIICVSLVWITWNSGKKSFVFLPKWSIDCYEDGFSNIISSIFNENKSLYNLCPLSFAAYTHFNFYNFLFQAGPMALKHLLTCLIKPEDLE